MLAQGVNPEKSKTIIEYSSGSTVISLALASRINHGIHDVRAFLSNKTSPAKLRLMQFFGLDVYVHISRSYQSNLILILLIGLCSADPHSLSHLTNVGAFIAQESWPSETRPS